MDLESALSVCRQVLNQYQAFKTLQEALEAAVLAQQLTKESQAKIGSLNEEVAALQKDKQKATEEVTQAQWERQRTLADTQKLADETKGNQRIKSEEMDKIIKEKQAQIDGLDQELEAGKEHITRELGELQTQVKQEEARLKAAQEALTALKDKL